MNNNKSKNKATCKIYELTIRGVTRSDRKISPKKGTTALAKTNETTEGMGMKNLAYTGYRCCVNLT